MMNNEQFERIMNRLDTLIKITAINAFQDKSRADVVRILASLGFNNKDIAMILGTTPAYVANVKYEFGKKGRQKGKSVETNETKEVEQE
jgi:hypothetical protein